MSQPQHLIRAPLPLIPGSDTGRAQSPTVSVRMSGHMHAYLLTALHQEAYTTSVSRYCRDIIAKHVAEQLGISPLTVISHAPGPGQRRRYRPG